MPDSKPSSPVADLVVVVPGILGTQLSKQGQPVWGLSGKVLWNGIKSLGESIKGLQLPAGLGDESPNDGIEPGGLMPDLHGVPGLGPFVGGYSDLSRWLLENLDLEPCRPGNSGNLLEFGYDWRLSNRHSAKLLKRAAEAALQRRRAEHPDAKLVFYCHSMGGLVARYYLEVLGGGEDTRTLVTVGTPHRGSLKALDNLVNGRKLKLGPLGFDVGTLTRSLPAAHQLLPSYRCLADGTERRGLRGVSLPHLDPAMVEDGLDFHAELERKAAANGEPPYGIRMIVGTRQPTLATARSSAEGVEPLLTIDGEEDLGDGTVPRFASIPPGVEPDDLRQLSSSRRHGWLQQSGAVLDDFYGILTAKRRVYMADAPDIEEAPGLELDELVPLGEPIQVKAQSKNERLRLSASLADASGIEVDRVELRNDGGGHYSAALEPRPEGVYTVTVSGPRSAGFAPVTEAVLIAGTG